MIKVLIFALLTLIPWEDRMYPNGRQIKNYPPIYIDGPNPIIIEGVPPIWEPEEDIA